MKQSLYALSTNYVQALDFLTDPDNDIDQQTAVDTMESLDGELDDKLLNVARMIVTLEHQAEGVKAVAKRQAERAKALESKTAWLKDYLKQSMQATGHDKASANDIAIKLAKTPEAVKVIDEALIPSEFWKEKIERSVDKTSIKNAGGCAGVVIESGFRVAIK